MICPPCPAGYVEYERSYHAGNWWFRRAPDAPWYPCRAPKPHRESSQILKDIRADRAARRSTALPHVKERKNV